MSKDLREFVRDQLGHEAKDLSLFELALTHKSVGGNQDYERLEFLGDRVLGHVMARSLYDRHPTEPEGYLSRRYNVLVARETCADIGRELGVPEMVRLGKQAREDGATQSDNVVGDVVESLIGALLIDGGLEAAERWVQSVWGPHLDEQRKAPHHPKSALQELAAAKGRKSPVYELVSRTGAAHSPVFTIKVSVPGLGEATATGTSKQDAETDAAEALLNKLQ
ncbi:MAG: ribonuclease III [Pseudomonadota bacterium]